MQLWIGILTLLGGVALWVAARREREEVPRWFQRVAVGVVALGVSTLVATRTGLAWSLWSIAFSLVAIVLLGSVIWENLRRR